MCYHVLISAEDSIEIRHVSKTHIRTRTVPYTRLILHIIFISPFSRPTIVKHVAAEAFARLFILAF